jgi:hypothetical protein
MTFQPERHSLFGIIGGLMVSDNLGDVHDELNHLCAMVGIPKFTGSFEEGWTEADWKSVGDVPNDEDEELWYRCARCGGLHLKSEGCPQEPDYAITEFIRNRVVVLNRLEPHLGCVACKQPLTNGHCPTCQGPQ